MQYRLLQIYGSHFLISHSQHKIQNFFLNMGGYHLLDFSESCLLSAFTQKKNEKLRMIEIGPRVLIKIEEMADIFLNLANFAPHVFLTLVPPSGYALNLKAMIKVSKVS